MTILFLIIGLGVVVFIASFIREFIRLIREDAKR